MEATQAGHVLNHVQQHLRDIPFKSLRREEAELSDEEKLAKMQDVLQTDPGLFLSRWGRHLPNNVLQDFQSLQPTNYEVEYHLKNLQNTAALSHATIHNRRFAYMKLHLRDTAYFSDESMQQRDPVLFEQYIGQHLTESEKAAPYGNDVNLVQRILTNIDRHYADEQVKQQHDIENEQFEEEEEEDESDDESDTVMQSAPSSASIASTPAPATTSSRPEREMLTPSSDENVLDGLPSQQTQDAELTESMLAFREEQRLEFVRLMEERFLAGKDPDFDYAQVDLDEAYDDLKQQEQDFQDKYFDDETPDEEVQPATSVYTGELDY
ncbi:coiled-coil domain-containing protein-domain-containing protein [Syncephalastrum racemosum]|uniref:Coiled-coil domain-containing protein-domain-containing protein n=1 Tax=Syncephalastrum racemosum TaxID=13706 RepID=A0A1X2HGR9_SYNRA|nr:coiled-coil domain-containing protein-domain-containing protein [Syncephalastrum racemosum]